MPQLPPTYYLLLPLLCRAGLSLSMPEGSELSLTVSGLSDLSAEEVRAEAYKSKAANTPDAYVSVPQHSARWLQFSASDDI